MDDRPSTLAFAAVLLRHYRQAEKSKIATAIIALPIPGNGLLALGALALVTYAQGDRSGWRSFRFGVAGATRPREHP